MYVPRYSAFWVPLYFLRKLNSFHVDRSIMHLFYKAIIESILVHDCVVWFYCLPKGRSLLAQKNSQTGGEDPRGTTTF